LGLVDAEGNPAEREATKRVVVYLPEKLVDRLRVYAIKRGVGLSVLIRMMILASVERESE
jgi:hypothetical protein